MLVVCCGVEFEFTDFVARFETHPSLFQTMESGANSVRRLGEELASEVSTFQTWLDESQRKGRMRGACHL